MENPVTFERSNILPIAELPQKEKTEDIKQKIFSMLMFSNYRSALGVEYGRITLKAASPKIGYINLMFNRIF